MRAFGAGTGWTIAAVCKFVSSFVVVSFVLFSKLSYFLSLAKQLLPIVLLLLAFRKMFAVCFGSSLQVVLLRLAD